jgi:tyrosine-specific transport protein
LTLRNTITTPRGIFVFAATIVGAGILALPVVASEAGFLPLAAMIVGLAAVSALSGLYIAESVLADQQSAHLPSLARRSLGPWGGVVVLPPLVVALMKPDAFVRTLDIAGTFGGGLFVGVLPVLMVLRLRRSGVPQGCTTWGGSALAWIVMAVYVAGMLYTLATLTFGP